MARKHDADTRETVRDAAKQLFAANGVRASSLADIAAAANVSKGTLYYYYPTKDYLVQDIAEEHFAVLSGRLFEWLDALVPDMSDMELITTLCDRLLGDEETAKLHFVLLCESVCGNEPLRARFDAKYSEWTVVMEMGALRTKSANDLHHKSKLLFCALDGCAMHALLGRDVPFSELGALFAGVSLS